MSRMSMPLLLGYPAPDKAPQVCFFSTSQRTRITCRQCFVLPYLQQDTVGSLRLEGALLADGQLVHQVTHGLLLENCFPDGWPSACTGELGYFSPGALLFTELHEIPLCPFLQPLPVLLNDSINNFITNLFKQNHKHIKVCFFFLKILFIVLFLPLRTLNPTTSWSLQSRWPRSLQLLQPWSSHLNLFSPVFKYEVQQIMSVH